MEPRDGYIHIFSPQYDHRIGKLAVHRQWGPPVGTIEYIDRYADGDEFVNVKIYEHGYHYTFSSDYEVIN